MRKCSGVVREFAGFIVQLNSFRFLLEREEALKANPDILRLEEPHGSRDALIASQERTVAERESVVEQKEVAATKGARKLQKDLESLSTRNLKIQADERIIAEARERLEKGNHARLAAIQQEEQRMRDMEQAHNPKKVETESLASKGTELNLRATEQARK